MTLRGATRLGGRVARAIGSSARSGAAHEGGHRVGVVFDIDGVLSRAKKALPGAVDALRLLDDAKIPFILLTNGGGVVESVKAEQVSGILGYEVKPAQVVVCHSPFRALAPKYARVKSLIVGDPDVMSVAAEYGLERAVSVLQLARHMPVLDPMVKHEHLPITAHWAHDAFGAVWVLHDVAHWSPALQISCDVLRGGTPLGSGRSQACDLFVSCPDFEYPAEHAVPRFACGAFVECLSHLFTRSTGGAKLDIQYVGKPFAPTFTYATAALAEWAVVTYGPGAAEFNAIYMIGDNPSGDIRGANLAGAPWVSVLVRTGLFRGPGNDETDPAHLVVDDVSAAVHRIVDIHSG